MTIPFNNNKITHDHLVAEQTKSYNVRTVNEYQILRAEKESSTWARILLTNFHRRLYYVSFRALATTASIIGVSKMD
jgi:hypothetical protein